MHGILLNEERKLQNDNVTYVIYMYLCICKENDLKPMNLKTMVISTEENRIARRL